MKRVENGCSWVKNQVVGLKGVKQVKTGLVGLKNGQLGCKLVLGDWVVDDVANLVLRGCVCWTEGLCEVA